MVDDPKHHERSMSQRVLVTGAGGFIGSHLVEHLVRQGATVRALTHYNSANHWFNLERLPEDCRRDVEVFPGDIGDPALVDDAVRGCETVFHLAALIGIPYSYRARASYVATNVIGTANVLEACLRRDVGRLVHTSTSEVYGSAQYIPIDESHPLVAQSPYAASKIGADKLVESFWHSFSLPTVTIRPFNTYGPRQSARAIVPTIISQALHGNAISLGNASPVRDLTYVDDTVAGFIAGARHAPGQGEVVNLGTGEGISVEELVTRVGRVLGKTLEIVSDESRVRPAGSEVTRLVSNNAKAIELLRWRPTTTLEEGLERTTTHIRSHLQEYKADVYTV